MYVKCFVLLFLIGIVVVMFYVMVISDIVGLIKNLVLLCNEVIVVFMLIIVILISIICKIDIGEVFNVSIFKFGMSVCVCVFGVVWLGDIFVKVYISDIQVVVGDLLYNYLWLLVVVLFFVVMLFYL